VNYALDRTALAAVTDSSPANDPIPPGIPGSGAPIDYPTDGPNIARARALAGSAKRTAILLVPPADRDPEVTELAGIVKRDLARIGIEVRARPFDDPWAEASKPGSRWDLFLDQWTADWSDPSDFVNTLFDPGAITHGWSNQATWPRYGDPRYVARMRAAHGVAGARRAAAYRALVADMMRMSPPAAVFAHTRSRPQLFSDRVGCQVFRPQDLGWVDLAALCLK
jgi:ABC-type transport system substrate-binding protein